MATIAPVLSTRGCGCKTDLRQPEKGRWQGAELFAMLAHKPEVLKTFLPFYEAIPVRER